MQDFGQKTNWLKAIGVEYYFEDKPTDYNPEPKHSHPELGSLRGRSGAGSKQTGSGIPNRARDDKLQVQDYGTTLSNSRTLADKASTIEELKKYVEDFEGCELKKFATNTVFAQGNPKASVMFIGEAPGATEDQKGVPFCGESGMLLDNMLKSIGISRETNAYITNTIFWRPPANRVPTQEEIEICRPFVEKHIALVNPKIIVLVGSTAVTSLFGKHAGITKIRGEYLSYSNKYLTKPVQATSIFHPAYLLRQSMQKKTSWYDLLKLQQFIVENP
jgi:uracil-DNA glycosylase